MRIFPSRFTLWCRYRRSRRQARREIAALKKELAEVTAEKRELERFFTRRMDVERARVLALNNAWADRFMQMQHLSPISIAAAHLEETVPQRPEADLTPAQSEYFDEMKKAFWQDGKALGKSEAEILGYWETKKFEILADTIQEIDGEDTIPAS